MVTTCPVAFEMFKIVVLWESLIKGQRLRNPRVLIKTIICTNFRPKSSKLSMKPHVPVFCFLSYWPCQKRRSGGTRTVRKSDYTPALALSKHMASVFDEKCREKENGVLNRRKPIQPYNKSLSIYITNFYPTIHIVFVILKT